MKRPHLIKVFLLAAAVPLTCRCAVGQTPATQTAPPQATPTGADAWATPVPPPADTALPQEMEKLFAAMESAAQNSAETFRPMSAEQLNHRPADGSHTPRWNVEHMAGRQLQFFSQLFHAVDARIPVIDRNPAQMPTDYDAAHPQWDGEKEAQRIEAVSAYCRRYAPLLADMDLDAKPPAGRWPSLRKLLVTMDKHYGQHTANVVKKTKADDWPSR